MKLIVGSLFSGIMGIDYGLELTGEFKTVWAVEKDLYAQKIIKKNFKEVKIYDDITKIEWETIESVDVLTGGFPCQDISLAGKREGIQGKRSGLWKEYVKAIRILRPRYVVIENVANLVNDGLNVVLADLASCGYDAEWDCLPASSFGASHRRDRVFILGILANTHSFNGRSEHQQLGKRKTRSDINRCCEVMADSESIKSRKQTEYERRKDTGRGSIDCGRIETERTENLSDSNDYSYWKQCQESLREKNRRTTWESESSVRRVANGVSNRVDRIRCLGNAVVPQVAEFIGLKIIKKEKDKK
jgi:DNA (cytosine-5)-methyltransferase 1